MEALGSLGVRISLGRQLTNPATAGFFFQESMKKQSKRRARPASEPALVRLTTNPEIGIAERMAIQAMRGGWADYQNSYRVLADCHGILAIGLQRKKDTSLDGVMKLAMIAMLNVYDRYIKTKKVGATGDELQALELLVDVSEDYWKRQSASALELAIVQLRAVRERQMADAKQLKKAA